MPLDGYKSCCQERAPVIVSRDRGGAQTHIAYNNRHSVVTHYQIDGVVITNGNRCDYLLINEDTETAYLIELKGSDLVWAAKQLESTEKALASQLAKYKNKQYRIVANKCKTQEIRSSEFLKYKMRWGKRLRYASKLLEDDI